MKKSIFVLVIALFFLKLHAQDAFTLMIQDTVNQSALTACSLNGFYYFSEYISNNDPKISGSRIYKIDGFGNIVKSVFMAGERNSFYPFVRDGQLYVLGCENNDSSFCYVLKHLRENLVVDGVYPYTAEIAYPLKSLSAPNVNHDGSITLANSCQDSIFNDHYYDAVDFVRINSDLESFYHKTFSIDRLRYEWAQYFIFQDSMFYCASSITPYFFDTELILSQYNHQMSLIRNHLFDGEDFLNLSNCAGLMNDSQGNIYLTGSTAGSENTEDNNRHIYIYKFNADLQYSMGKSLFDTGDSSYYTAMCKSLDINKNDEIFIAGGRPFTHDSSPLFVAKLDTSLNELWRYFMYSGDGLFCRSVNACSDGGCVITAETGFINGKNGSLLLKLNDQGLITEIGNPLPDFNISPLLISPNPGLTNMRIDLGAQLGECSFELFTINGRPVLQKMIRETGNIINTSGLSSGSYIYKVSNTAGFEESGKWVKK